MMRALTLHMPWAWAVAAGHKPVENRPWPPPQNMIGVPFAIHAGKKFDEVGHWFVAERVPGGTIPDEARAAGVIIGVATVDRVVGSRPHQPGLFPDGDPATLTELQRSWFFGPYGWVLRDVVQLDTPVACRGYQMFWTLPIEVEREVRAQLVRVAQLMRSPTHEEMQ